jgi:uncharacterized membrane protein YccC
MDGQMRLAALVLGLLFLLGIATVVISSNLFNYTPFRTASEITTDPDTDALLSTRKHTPRSNRIQLATGEQDSVATRAQLARLEVLLKERTDQLEDRNGRVDELNSQLRQLRSNTAARPSARPAPRNPTRTESRPAGTGESDLREEIQRLNQILLDADLQDAEYRQQIATLRDSLGQANEQLDLLEDGADAQLANTAVRQRGRERLIGDLVARFGSESVPLLVDFLEEDDPQLRIWAIQVLGLLGDDAELALDDITSLFEDPSADVRNAARRAVDSIRGR